MPSGTLLVVEDEANQRKVLSALLRRAGFDVHEAANGAAALEVLERESIDAVLSDLRMPQLNGLELLGEVTRLRPEIPVVLLTAHGTVGSAVEALKCGAFDYLTKPFEPDEVVAVMRKALEAALHAEREPRVAGGDDVERLLDGDSPALVELRRVIERVARTPATVLISGESGTGKEIVARGLHRRSDRDRAPFVKINCAAIPDGLLESELFGYKKGAFTGANQSKPGRFELADGGTLLLDEIGEMPLAAQPKLLRAIQDGRFYPVGGTETVEVDVRLVAATNRDLRAEVREGRFREDLFYRLNVVPVAVPPLRERRDDIADLAAFFLERHAQRCGVSAGRLEPDALARLRSHAWPGNLRELENTIERAALLGDGEAIRAADIQIDAAPSAESAPCDAGAPLKERVRAATQRIEREAIMEALELTRGNVTRAAEQLGLSRRGLQLKMRELEIQKPD